MTTRRLAVVTGASSGIGAATATVLAGNGWRVVMVARGAQRLEEVAARLRTPGGDVVPESCDAGDGASVMAMARRVMDEHGVPEVIVNSAGAGTWHFIQDTPPDTARQMMAAPFWAAYNTTHAFIGAMLARRRGVLVHVGSPASIVPWPGATAYTAARWALRGLHESLVQDLRGTGVRSCHAMFGPVSSGYWDHNPGVWDRAPTIAKRLLPELTPEQCGAMILDLIRRPRNEIIRPPIIYSQRWLPRPLVRWLLARTTPV